MVAGFLIKSLFGTGEAEENKLPLVGPDSVRGTVKTSLEHSTSPYTPVSKL